MAAGADLRHVAFIDSGTHPSATAKFVSAYALTINDDNWQVFLQV